MKIKSGTALRYYCKYYCSLLIAIQNIFLPIM
jgi:hypothetical protein